MELEYVNEHIGRKIKDLRNQNGLTQQELADRTELTKGFISQLERGQVSPSVGTLLDLIECLGTTASDFFKETEEEQIVFSENGFFEKVDDVGNQIQWIVPTAQKYQMEPLLVTIAPHQRLDEDKPHSGEEFGYLISGRVEAASGREGLSGKSGKQFLLSCKGETLDREPGQQAGKIHMG